MISLNPTYPNQLLTHESVDFGRKSSCRVQIKHPAVSGIHCELTNLGSGEVWLKDHSTNGTFVNGTIVGKGKKVLLHDGSEIVLIKSATDKIGYKFVIIDSDKKELVSWHAIWHERSHVTLTAPPPLVTPAHRRCALRFSSSCRSPGCCMLQNEAEQKYKLLDTLGT